MDDILSKYNKTSPVYYPVPSGRVYAAVIGTSKDGLLLNISFEFVASVQVENSLMFRMAVAVRGIIRGTTYLKSFEWDNREGEVRIEKKVITFADVLTPDNFSALEVLQASTFFKDLAASLKFHGCLLNKDELSQLLSQPIKTRKDVEAILVDKFAFNF